MTLLEKPLHQGVRPVDDVEANPPRAGRRWRPGVGGALYWAIPMALLFVVPLVWWTGFTGTTMNLGGDDSHLMYAYPSDWLQHVGLSVVQGNLAGYNPGTYFIPFQAVLIGVHSIGLNPQGFAMAVVLSLTYAGVTRLVLELVRSRSWQARAAAAAAGVIAVSAPLVAETLWVGMLTAVFWSPLLPWLVLFFIWHQRTGHTRWVVVGGAAITVSAVALTEFPWTISCLLCAMGIALVAWLVRIYNFHPLRAAGMLAGVVAVNAFWLLPVLAFFPLGQGQVTAALSTAGHRDAHGIVSALAPLMSPTDVMSLRNSHALQEAYAHFQPALIPDLWSRRLWPIGWIPAAAIAVAAVVAMVRRRDRGLIAGMIALVMVFFYFESLQLVPNGSALFLWLTDNVPGWTAERNFFDKFALPFTLMTAVATGVALWIILRQVNAKFAAATGLVVIAAFVAYDEPFYAGDIFRLPYYGSGSFNRVNDGLPAAYLEMLETLKKQPDGAVLSLPVSYPAWSVVSDGDPHHAYVGISPVYYLTGRSDYDGVQAFESPVAPWIQTLARDDLARVDLEAFSRLVQETGVRYVLWNHGSNVSNSFYGVGELPDELEAVTTQRLAEQLAPTVIARSGSFELRQVGSTGGGAVTTISADRPWTDPYVLDRINEGLVPSPEGSCPGGEPATEKVSAVEYHVTVPAEAGGCSLMLRVAYGSPWSAAIADGRGGTLRPVMVDSYAQGFRLPAVIPKGGLRIVITYGAASLVGIGLIGSALAWLAVAAIGFGVRRRRLCQEG